MINSKIKILDCTLRDGSYQNNFQFTKNDNLKITKILSDAGIEYIEVGHGLGLGAYRNKKYSSFENDITYIKSSIIGKNKKLGVFFIPEFGKILDIKKAISNGVNFIRVGTEVNDFKNTRKYLDVIKSYNAFSCLNLMKTYNSDVKEITSVINKIEKWKNIDVVYVVDSAGCMTPEDVDNYVTAIKENSDLKIGFHGHNNMGLANANSIAAINSGASYIDSSVKGLGRSAGNAQTEILCYLLKKNGIECNINFFELMDLGEKYLKNIVPNFNSLSSIDIMLGISKIHSSSLPILFRSASDYDINIYRLIFEVSLQNIKNINRKNINIVAKELSRIEK